MLRVLHGAILEGSLWLWAEEKDARSDDELERGDHPHASTADDLREALSALELPWSLDFDELTETELWAWLPTRSGHPLPSLRVLEGSDDDLSVASHGAAEVSLKPWLVDALRVDGIEACELLSELLQRRMLGPALLAGPDLRALAYGLKLVGSMLIRQRVVPSLDTRQVAKGKALPLWRLVWEGDDRQRLASFAASLPGGCRALSTSADRAPSSFAVVLIEELFDKLAASLLQFSLRPESLRGLGAEREDEPPHQIWLRSLVGVDRSLSSEQAKILESGLELWQGPLLIASEVAARLVLRLEDPNPIDISQLGEEQAPWTLRLLVESLYDTDLIAPLADFWVDPAAFARRFSIPRGKLEEHLLRSLGEARRLCPELEELLAETRPAVMNLPITAAFKVLKERAEVLKEAGFRVILPLWWRNQLRSGVKLQAYVASPNQKSVDLDAQLRFDFEVSIGNRRLSIAEFEGLVALERPLVRMGSDWVELRGDEVESILDRWKRRRLRTITLRDALTAELLGQLSTGIDGIEAVRLDGWLSELAGSMRRDQPIVPVEKPRGLKATLRPYQQRGLDWLAFLKGWGWGACLADDMGLGKTLQTIALILSDRQSDKPKHPYLIIAPTSLVENWRREILRFAPSLKVYVHQGLRRLKGRAFTSAIKGQHVIISTYPLVNRDCEMLSKARWRGLVIDEAQAIKNPETRQTIAVKKLKADFRIALTGTPVENSLRDLWSIFDFLNPGLLGSLREFTNRLGKQAEEGDESAGQTLRALVRPFMLRRAKTDEGIADELPPKIETKRYCNLTSEQAELYQEVVTETMYELGEADGQFERRAVILKMLTRLKQVCNHPAHFLADESELPQRSGKLEQLLELLAEIDERGEKALIFTQYTKMGDLLCKDIVERLGRPVEYFHGDLNTKARNAVIERFQDPNRECLALILSLRAGGVGLNLTAAQHVIHFDRWWNPAVENQATDRAYRIGQTRRVLVHKLISKGTLEERIDDLIESKQALAASIVGSGEDWLGKLSSTEIAEIVTLRLED